MSSTGLPDAEIDNPIPFNRDAIDMMLASMGKQASSCKVKLRASSNVETQPGLQIHKSGHGSSNTVAICRPQPRARPAGDPLGPLRRCNTISARSKAPPTGHQSCFGELPVTSGHFLPSESLPQLAVDNDFHRKVRMSSDGGCAEVSCTATHVQSNAASCSERGGMVRSQAIVLADSEVDQGTASRCGSLHCASSPGINLAPARQLTAAAQYSPLSDIVMVEQAESVRSVFLRLANRAQALSISRRSRPSHAGRKAAQAPMKSGISEEDKPPLVPSARWSPDKRRVGQRADAKDCSQLPDSIDNLLH
jgi:hypothetical protein